MVWSFTKVWEKEGELLENCGTNKFRSKQDYTHWLMKCWQICEGNFAVRSTGWGHHYELWEDDIKKICRSIERQTYPVICLNDSKAAIAFEDMKKMLKESFTHILPDLSEFEQTDHM